MEITRCQGVGVQCQDSVPTVSVDNSSATKLYLTGAGGLATEVITSRSDELNIITPGASEDDGMTEAAVPEQFVTKYIDGSWRTAPVEHTGA